MYDITIKAENGYEMTPSNDAYVDFTASEKASWQFPQFIGKGCFKQIKLRSGFYLFITDCQVNQDCIWHTTCNRPGFGFTFCVSGHTRARSMGMGKSVATCQGQSQLFYFPCQSGTGRVVKETRTISFSIIIEPTVFNALVGSDCQYFPGALRSIIDGTKEHCYYQPGVMTPETLASFESVLHCPLSGPASKLFLESKILELIAYRLRQIEEYPTEVLNFADFSMADIERIYQAAEILAQKMQNPPTLFDLARSVGMSHAKMNRGFHKVYNTTVFGYLRRIRLQHSKRLLETGRMNVTQAAFMVGYNSLSSFTRAFHKQFGINPHRCIHN